ncbi:MAG: SPOR domain-containing protein [Acidiferrobacterales bacterium]
MASRQEAETDFEPRHRILGAIVLVALGFILFSVVLNDKPQRFDPGEMTATAEPNTRVVVTTVPPQKVIAPLPVKKPVKTKAVTNPLAPKPRVKKTAKTKDSGRPTAVKPFAAKPTTSAKTAPVKKAVPVTKKVTTVGGKLWMVQVGTFSDPANARRLDKKLTSQQYRVVTKTVTLKGGRAVRVRVGPYTSRKSATTARDQIETKNGIKGVVLAQN